MTAAFVALSLGLAIQSVGQAYGSAPVSVPGNGTQRYAPPAAAGNAPQAGAYWIPQQNGLASVPYYYPYQKRRKFWFHDYILPPGPGNGWGFPNGAPDAYGWADYGPYLPLNGDRNGEYFFPRYFVVPPEQLWFPTYYNPYETRGQRYLPYVADGGAHPAGGAPLGSAELPMRPYGSMPGRTPAVNVPRLNGRAEAPYVTSGTSGLTP